MKTEVVVVNKKFTKEFAMTTVYDSTGKIATFSYNPSIVSSVVQRLKDFIVFSQAGK